MVHRLANRLRADYGVYRRTFEVGRNPTGLATSSPSRIKSARCHADGGEVMFRRLKLSEMCESYKHSAPSEQAPRPQAKTSFCARLFAEIVAISLLIGCNGQLPGKP